MTLREFHDKACALFDLDSFSVTTEAAARTYNFHKPGVVGFEYQIIAGSHESPTKVWSNSTPEAVLAECEAYMNVPVSTGSMEVSS